MFRISKFLFFIPLIMISCNREVYIDYDFTECIIFENKSSHTITIKRAEQTNYPHSENYLPESITIVPDKSYKVYVGAINMCIDFATAAFDNKVVIDYNTAPDNAYNIRSSVCYFQQTVDKYNFYFIYSFMDADYEHALKYGTKLE